MQTVGTVQTPESEGATQSSEHYKALSNNDEFISN